MFEKMFSFFGRGRNVSVEGSNEILAKEGFSSQYADVRVREIRNELIEFRKYRDEILKEAPGADSQKLAQTVNRVCASVEKVAQILRASPEDFSRTGLSLEALPRATEILKQCAGLVKSAGSGTASVVTAEAALSKVATNFEVMAQQRLTADNQLRVGTLSGTVEDLTRGE